MSVKGFQIDMLMSDLSDVDIAAGSPAIADGDILIYNGVSFDYGPIVAGAAALNDLTDVVIGGSPLVTDQVLTFNGTNWVNANNTAGLTNPLTADLNVGSFNIVSSDESADVAGHSIRLVGGDHSYAGGTQDAGGVILAAGGGTNGNNGGAVSLSAGTAATTGDGGNATLSGGGALSTGDGGDVNITAGVSGGGATGFVQITGGSSSGTSTGGRVFLLGGFNFGSGNGGDVDVSGGHAPSGLLGGDVNIKAGGGVGATGGTVNLHAPTVQTGQAALRLWKDTNTIHTTGNYAVLTVSASLSSDVILTLPTKTGELQLKHLDINAQTELTYTLASTDDGVLVTMSNVSANEVTIPADAIGSPAFTFPIGTQILVEQENTGTTTIVAAGSPPVPTIHSPGNAFDLASQYTTVTLIKKAANTWLLIGDLV